MRKALGRLLALVGLNGRYKVLTWIVCIALFAASPSGSFLTGGPLQSFCIEGTVGIALLIALDRLWGKWSNEPAKLGLKLARKAE